MSKWLFYTSVYGEAWLGSTWLIELVLFWDPNRSIASKICLQSTVRFEFGLDWNSVGSQYHPIGGSHYWLATCSSVLKVMVTVNGWIAKTFPSWKYILLCLFAQCSLVFLLVWVDYNIAWNDPTFGGVQAWHIAAEIKLEEVEGMKIPREATLRLVRRAEIVLARPKRMF
jgi:hypothetical protein